LNSYLGCLVVVKEVWVDLLVDGMQRSLEAWKFLGLRGLPPPPSNHRQAAAACHCGGTHLRATDFDLVLLLRV
jgi:hypothetical protein